MRIIDLTRQPSDWPPSSEPSPASPSTTPRRRAVEDQPQPPASPQPTPSTAPNSASAQGWQVPLQALELTRWQSADTVPPAAPKGANQRVIKGRSLKVVVPLDPAEIVTVATPDGVARVHLRVDVAGHKLAISLAMKSLRKAKATIAEHGADNVMVFIQGKLVADRIDECGLAAQPKIRPGAEAAT